MKLRQASIAALVSGLLISQLSALPIVYYVNYLFCGWLWLGGAFAVWFYKRLTNEEIDSELGAAIGAATGLVAVLISTLLGFFFSGISLGASLILLDWMYRLNIYSYYFQIRPWFWFHIPINIAFYTVFGTVGGVIATALQGRNTKRII